MSTATGSWPSCHHCAAPAELQWPREATPGESAAHFDALEQNIRASGNPGYIHNRNDTVRIAVYGCGDHALEPLCVHTEPQPDACPICHAAPGDACAKPDGTPRPVEHPARVAAQPQPDTCTHAHQADCGGYGACHCRPTVGAG